MKKSKISDNESAEPLPESAYAWSLTRIAVSQTCESVGFKRTQTSALRVLTDVAALYLKSIAKTAAVSANRHGRTESNFIDIVFALEELAAAQGFPGASSVLGAGRSGVIKDLMKFVKYSDEIPFAQALPLGGVFNKGAVKCRGRNGCTVEYNDQLSYVPRWLPCVPVVAENVVVVEERRREVRWECLVEKGIENVVEETRKGGEIRSMLQETREAHQDFDHLHKFDNRVGSKMLMGHAEGVPKFGSSKELLLSDPVSELEADEVNDTAEILYAASFEELAANYIRYDTIIWLSISLVLVLAWGVGVIMLLYLPYRRYVLWKDLASRRLYVTSKGIAYKASRPSYIPFRGEIKIEKHVPLSRVIDIIIEQGCLQSVLGLHTIRVESIAHGKAAPVDELQVQGVHVPGFLRKVIVTHASKAIQDLGQSRTPNHQVDVDESMYRMESLTLGPAVLRSPSKGWKTLSSPYHPSVDPRGVVPTDLMLHKLEEVNMSVKKIEFLMEKNQGQPSTVFNPDI